MRPGTGRGLTAALGLTIIVAASVFLAHTSISLKKEHSSLEKQRSEILKLREEFLSLKTTLVSVEGKKASSKAAGIVQTVDELFRSMGLNQRLKSVKSMGAMEKRYSTEEEAEVQVEKASMNEMVNIFYKIENGPALLSVRKTTIRTNFENPSLLNITMTIDLIKPK